MALIFPFSYSECANVLQFFLGKYVFREMERAFHRRFPESQDAWYKNMPAELVDQAIKDAFLSLDRDIIDGGAQAATGKRFLNDAMSELAPSYSGSCALLSLYVCIFWSRSLPLHQY